MWITDVFNKHKKQNNEETSYIKFMDGSQPLFSQFGDNVYASDVVQQAIACIVNELKKVKAQHVKEENFNILPIKDSNYQYVLDNPNDWMTQTEFIEKVAWNLLLKFNSFIVPDYDKDGKLLALYPVNPRSVKFESSKNGEIYITMDFGNGYSYPIRYKDVIHLRYRYSKNELMGGNQYGNPDYDSLLQTLEINNTLMEGLPKALKASLNVTGIVQGVGLYGNEKLEKNLKDLTTRLQNNESGFMTLDSKFNFTPIMRDVKGADESILKFIDEKILRTWGVSLPILTGDYTPQQYEAFYQKAVEPIVITFEQSFTKALFSKREQSFKNRIKFYTKELVFMSVDQKLNFIKELGGRGALTNGFMLSLFGVSPDVAGDYANKRYISLNYIDADIANEYQLNNAGATQKLNKVNNIINDGESDDSGGDNNGKV